MPIPSLAPWLFTLGMMVLGAGAVSGQTYPTKPVRIITSTTGGSSDFTSRMIAPGLTERLRQVVAGNAGGQTLHKDTPLLMLTALELQSI